MRGQAQIDEKVWIVKSHFPMGKKSRQFDANKCILLVRNPMDVMMSVYNKMATKSHD